VYGAITRTGIIYSTTQQAARNVKFYIYIGNEQIKKVDQFKYLGRIITTNDNDLQAVEQQLGNARKIWGRIGKLIKKCTNNNPKVLSAVYKAIVMSVLLYGAESWVINSTLINKLNSFHSSCARTITGCHIKLLEDGTWEYPSSSLTLKLAKLLPLETYIRKIKMTVSNYVQSTTIYQDCKLRALVYMVLVT
jgi:hypothetical protein